jgi:hypothetical protein
VETPNKHLWNNPEKAIRAFIPRNLAVLIKALKRTRLTARITHIGLLSSVNGSVAHVTGRPFKRTEEGVLVADLLGRDAWAVIAELRRLLPVIVRRCTAAGFGFSCRCLENRG